MTSASLLQVAVYLLVFVALVKPLGAYMARVFEGERTLYTGRRARRAPDLSPRGRRSVTGDRLAPLRAGSARGQLRRLRPSVRAATHAGFPTLEPAGLPRCLSGLVIRHRDQFRFEHQ